jgi:hypothetical protein
MKKYIIIYFLWILIQQLAFAQKHEFAFGTRFMKTQDFSADYVESVSAIKFLNTVYVNQNKTDYYLRYNAKNNVTATSTGYNSPSLGLSYKYNFKAKRLKIKVGIIGLIYNQAIENNINTKLDIINFECITNFP